MNNFPPNFLLVKKVKLVHVVLLRMMRIEQAMHSTSIWQIPSHRSKPTRQLEQDIPSWTQSYKNIFSIDLRKAEF